MNKLKFWEVGGRCERRDLTSGLTLGKTNKCLVPGMGFITVLLQKLLLALMNRGREGDC